jgi:2-dehydro-3-deoxygluconokinase
MTPDMFDWKGIFSDCDWFHFTGITPALSKTAAATVQAAVDYAKRHHIPVSCDINFRSNLWTRRQAARVMRPLVEGIRCIFGNEADAKDVFGIGPSASAIETGSIDPEMYRGVLTQLLDKYNIKMGAMTVRQSHSAFHNDWSAVFHDGRKFYVSQNYHIRHIIDRLGSGDSFSSAMIYGILTGKNIQEALDFATAASCLKHSIPGSLNLVSQAEVEELMKTGGTGRVKR